MTNSHQRVQQGISAEQRERVIAALTHRFLDNGLVPALPEKVRKLEKLRSIPFSTQEEKKERELKIQTIEDDIKKNQLSRALAAYAVAHHLDLTDIEGAGAVVDGADDNGIDAIAIYGKDVYLVQAKFKAGNPVQEDSVTFVKGARELREHKFDNFLNPLFLNRRSDIEKSVRTPGVRFHLIFVHMGQGVIRHARKVIEDYQNERACEFQDMKGIDVYNALLEDNEPLSIDAELTIYNHTLTANTPKVAYGLASARSLARLHHQHKSAIFGRNIRSFLGQSEINLSIEKTLREMPEAFVHLNNGITIVCREFDLPGNVQGDGTYALQGLSIVNGAQTVGSMARVFTDDEDGRNLSDALVQVTIIQTKGAATDLAEKVTHSRNTQNPVPRQAFAAQDPLHEGLRQLLAMHGIKYVYKPGADIETADLTLEDVARALVTFDSDPTEALIDSLHTVLDVTSPTYRRIFRLDIGGSQDSPLRQPEILFRQVEIYRQIEKTLKEKIPLREDVEEDDSIETQFYTYMRPLARYWIVQRSGLTRNMPSIVRLSKDERTMLSNDIAQYGDEILREIQKFINIRNAEDESYSMFTLRGNYTDWRTVLNNLAVQSGITLTNISHFSGKLSQ